MKTIVDYINDRLLSHTKIYLNESRGIFDGCYDLAIFLNEKITTAISKNKSYIEIDKNSIEDAIKQEVFFEKISLLIDRTSDIFTARYRLDNVNLSDSGLLEEVCIYIGVKEYSKYRENYVSILVHELTHAFNNYNLIIHGASSIYDMVKDIDYDRMRDFHAHNVPSIIRELRRSLYILQPYEKNSFISQLITNVKELIDTNQIEKKRNLTSAEIMDYIRKTDIYNAYKDISILVSLYKNGELSESEIKSIEDEYNKIYRTNNKKCKHIMRILDVLMNRTIYKIETVLPKHMIHECEIVCVY